MGDARELPLEELADVLLGGDFAFLLDDQFRTGFKSSPAAARVGSARSVPELLERLTMTKPTKTKMTDLMASLEDDIKQFRDALLGELGRLRAAAKPDAVAKRVRRLRQAIRGRLSAPEEKD